MPRVTCNDRVVAEAEVASTFRARLTGLLGRRGIDGALVLRPASWVHTIGMRFDIDVAYLDGDGVVIRATTMPRNRVGRPVPGSRAVVEAEAGSFARWGMAVGDRVRVEDGRA